MENNNSYSRREFVKLSGMAGAAALIAPGFAFEEAKKRKFKRIVSKLARFIHNDTNCFCKL